MNTTSKRYVQTASIVLGLLALAPAMRAADAVPAPANDQPATAATGVVTGRVINAATRNYLGNVEVRDDASGQVAYTDADGYFSIVLPTGARDLSVIYTGLDTNRRSVAVAAGTNALGEIALTSAEYGEVLVMDQFVVAAEKEGRAASLTAQKRADNLVNVISSDEFSNVAGGNVGDFLRNVPGITIEYSGQDPRNIRMRGMDPNMNAVTVNGMRSANASSSSANRKFDLDQISLQDIESVEIYKTATPAQEADSGGGSVNFVSKSAFKQKGRRINYSVGGNGNSMNYTFGKSRLPNDQPDFKVRPTMTISYSDVFLNNRLGVSFSANWNEFYQEGMGIDIPYTATASRNSTSATGWYTASDGRRFNGYSPGEAPDSPLGAYVKQIRWGPNANITDRRMFALNFDFKLSDAVTLWSRNQVNTSLIYGGARNIQLNGTDLSNNSTTQYGGHGATGIQAGWSDQSITVVGNSPTADPYARTYADYLYKTGTGTTFALGADAKWGDWKVNVAGSVSHSSNRYDVKDEANNPISQAEFYLRNISYRVDTPVGTNYPLVTQIGGASIYDLANYTSVIGTGARTTVAGTGTRDPSTNITYPNIRYANVQNNPLQFTNGRKSGGKDQFRTFKVDARRTFRTRIPLYLQAGASLRTQIRTLDKDGQTRYYYTGDRTTLGSDIAALVVPTSSFDFDGAYYQNVPMFNLDALNSYFVNNRHLFTEDFIYRYETERAGKRRLQEDVTAGYLMGNVRFGKLTALIGARYERTQTEGTGPILDIDAGRNAAIADYRNWLVAYNTANGTTYYAVTAGDTGTGNNTAVPGTILGSGTAAGLYQPTNAQLLNYSIARYAKTTTVNEDYGNVYPSINLKYDLTKDFLLRAGFAKTIGRQNMDYIIPGLNATTSTAANGVGYYVDLNNTALKPVFYNNYDVSVEYYLPNSGAITAGFFYKGIKNYTVTFEQVIDDATIAEYAALGYNLSGNNGDTLRTRRNAGKAKMAGIELSYTQSLSQFSDYLKGFRARLGYTYHKGDSTATYGGTGLASSNLPLVNFIPRLFNAGLSYNRTRYSVSLIYNWRYKYVNSLNTYPGWPSDTGFFRYTASRGTLDLSISYKFYRSHELYLDVRNLTNVPKRDYIGAEYRTRSYNIDGAAIYAGIKGQF